MSDPFATLKFAQGITQGAPSLTQLGGLFQQQQAQVQAQRAQAQAQQAYQDSLRAYMQNQSPSNLMALYEAAGPLGKFDQVKQSVASMTESQRREEARRNMNILAPLSSDNPDVAKSILDQYASAYKNAGDDQMAQQMGWLKQQIDEGKIEEVKAFLSIQTGVTEEGREALENMISLNQERRAETEQHLEIFKGAQELNLPQEEIDRLMTLAEEEGDAPVQQLLYYATALENGGSLSDEDYNDIVATWNEKYFKRTEPFREALRQGRQVEQSYAQAMEASGGPQKTTVVRDLEGNPIEVTSGTYDIALMNAFQRMIDPATVREGDIELQQGSATVDQQALRLLDRWFLSGGQLTSEQRRAIMDMTQRLQRASAEDAQSAGQSVLEFTDRIGVLRPDITGGFDEEILEYYTPSQSTSRTSSAGGTDDSQQFLQNRGISATEQEVRAALIGKHPDEEKADPENSGVYAKGIENMSVEELIQNYPRALRELGIMPPATVNTTTSADGREVAPPGDF